MALLPRACLPRAPLQTSACYAGYVDFTHGVSRVIELTENMQRFGNSITQLNHAATVFRLIKLCSVNHIWLRFSVWRENFIFLPYRLQTFVIDCARPYNSVQWCRLSEICSGICTTSVAYHYKNCANYTTKIFVKDFLFNGCG